MMDCYIYTSWYVMFCCEDCSGKAKFGVEYGFGWGGGWWCIWWKGWLNDWIDACSNGNGEWCIMYNLYQKILIFTHKNPDLKNVIMTPFVIQCQAIYQSFLLIPVQSVHYQFLLQLTNLFTQKLWICRVHRNSAGWKTQNYFIAATPVLGWGKERND